CGWSGEREEQQKASSREHNEVKLRRNGDGERHSEYPLKCKCTQAITARLALPLPSITRPISRWACLNMSRTQKAILTLLRRTIALKRPLCIVSEMFIH